LVNVGWPWGEIYSRETTERKGIDIGSGVEGIPTRSLYFVFYV
jgi:hypothetical protein